MTGEGHQLGRRESPLDPSDGPAERFAFELRALRQSAGGLTYRAMACRTEYSTAPLSQAASGDRLPSLPVVLAYVTACGGDRAQWERRWQQVTDQLMAQPPEDDDAVPPYPGLRRFQPDDRERFFGRDRLTEDLAALVRARRFAAVVGTSGSGKSSQLRAGLIPALRTENEGTGRERTAALRILTPGPHSTRNHAHLLAPAEGEGDTVVVIDQFEETFTLCQDPAERAEFIDLLLTARNPEHRLRVVIAIRADFFDQCAAHRALADALRDTTLLVAPMTPAELREAIIKPAATEGLIVERTLTARLVEEVADEPGGLPLLSHDLLETWRRRRARTPTPWPPTRPPAASTAPSPKQPRSSTTGFRPTKREPPAGSCCDWSPRARARPTPAARQTAPNSKPAHPAKRPPYWSSWSAPG